MYFRLVIALSSLVLFSSCMKIDSHIGVTSSGSASYSATLDVSQMMTLLSSFGTGENTPIEKDLCKNEDFQDSLEKSAEKQKDKIDAIVCTSLGDYKARIDGTIHLDKKKSVLVLSGVTIVDLLAFSDVERSPYVADSNDASMNPEDLGFSIKQTYTLPGKIAYTEVGTLSGASTLIVNLLDKNVLKRKSLIAITTESGEKLTQKQIMSYKRQYRAYISKKK